MNIKEEVIKLQEIANNAWPAKEYFFLNGWIIRFSDGATSRANSVLPIYYHGNDLESDIKKVEEAYRAHGLKPIFMLHDYHEPIDLSAKLIKLGYIRTSYSVDIMGTELKKIPKTVKQEKFEIFSSIKRTNEWTEALFRLATNRSKEELKGICQIMDRIIIPQTQYFSAVLDEMITGIILGIFYEGYLGIMDLIVDPEYRRKGIATLLFLKAIEWAEQKSGHLLYLQVVRENYGAVRLYSKLKLRPWYSYYYMMKE